MGSLLPLASEPHPAWSPFAAEIHAAVWEGVGLVKVQEYVRRWAAEYGRLWDAWEAEREKACTDNKHYNPGSPQVHRQVESNWSDSLGVDERECRRLLPPLLIGAKPPEEPLLPLPPSHRRLSFIQKWAGLAAVHDHYWLDGEKILPWGESPDGEVDEASVRWEEAAGWFRALMGEAAELDEEHRPVLTAWLKEVRETGSEKRPRRRRPSTARKPRPLTARQTEVVQVVAECRQNFAAAAKRLGRDRKTVEESYRAAMQKLGMTAVKHGTKLLPHDRRGQANLSDSDDRRLNRPDSDDTE